MSAFMELAEAVEAASQLRQRFAAFEERTYGTAWTVQDLLVGLITDVGDLSRLVQTIEGRRPAGQSDGLRDSLTHELCDCLWVLLVLADAYDINLDDALPRWHDALGTWLEARAEQGKPTHGPE